MKKLLLLLLCVPLMFSCGENKKKNKKKSKESQVCKCERYKEKRSQLLRGGEDEEQLKEISRLESKIKNCDKLEEIAYEKGEIWECNKYINKSTNRAKSVEKDISTEDNFLKHVNNTKFRSLKETKILCFFDAGCESCMEAAKSLTDLAKKTNDFPEIHIMFSESEEDRIPEFFIYTGKEYSHQVIQLYNDDVEINSYLEILGFEYENPVVILYDGNRPIYLFEGIDSNSFNINIIENIIRNVKNGDKYKDLEL